MAYVITCDNPDCGGEIDAGSSGSPTGSAKRSVYCGRCAAYLEIVDEELRREESRLAREASEFIQARKKELMKQYVPENKLGAAVHSPPEAIPANPSRGLSAPSPWPIAVTE